MYGRVALGLAAAALLAGCAEAGAPVQQGGQAAERPGQQQREDVNVDAEFTSSCDVQLPADIMSGDYAFVGAVKITNTGNVGVEVRVRARFDQVASPNVKDEKTVRVRRGKRRSVKFRIPATQQQVDEHQDSPDYFNGEACKVTPTIIDSFGRAPAKG